jgi:AcrR family transcriptional regulator
MREDVKRPYDASGRRERSARRRQEVIDATRSLLVERGYGGTTVAAVADSVGVHVDTVYRLVGRKSELVAEVVEQALSGVDAVVPAVERSYVADILAESDPGAKLDRYADATVGMLVRLAPIVRALRDAGEEGAEAQALWREFAERRATNLLQFADDLLATGGVRADLDREAVATEVWLHGSPETYLLLTGDRGWTTDRYRRWLAATWRRTLLAP